MSDNYDYQIGDIIKIKPIEMYKNDYLPEDNNLWGLEGRVMGYDSDDCSTIDDYSSILYALTFFRSTIPSRKTMYVIELKDGTLVDLYYGEMELVKSNYVQRMELMNRMTEIKLLIEDELMKPITNYRAKKLKELRSEYDYIVLEHADDEMIQCSNHNVKHEMKILFK